MNRKRIVVWAGVGLGLLLVLACGTVAGLAYWREQNLPVYTMGQRPPERNMGVNTLTLGSVVYISGPDEFPLQPIWPPFAWFNRIGSTVGGEFYVYRPDGQTGDDYVFASGEMTGDTVYRNSRIPPVTLASLPVSEIRLAQNTSGTPVKKTTRDAQVIREVIDALTDTRVQPVRFPRDDDVTGDLGYVLLLSERLPGLGYMVYVHADDGGRVFLQAMGAEDTWVPVGESFARWARE